MFRDSKTGRISRPVPACSPANLKRRATVPEADIGNKSTKKEGPEASYSKRPTDWLTSVLTEILTDWNHGLTVLLFRCCVDTLFCCFTDVLFCWPSVLLFCRHIDLRISVGYRGLERQQDFGCCPHSCLAKGWPPSQWWKLNKHTIETAETDRTPQNHREA